MHPRLLWPLVDDVADNDALQPCECALASLILWVEQLPEPDLLALEEIVVEHSRLSHGEELVVVAIVRGGIGCAGLRHGRERLKVETRLVIASELLDKVLADKRPDIVVRGLALARCRGSAGLLDGGQRKSERDGVVPAGVRQVVDLAADVVEAGEQVVVGQGRNLDADTVRPTAARGVAQVGSTVSADERRDLWPGGEGSELL